MHRVTPSRSTLPIIVNIAIPIFLMASLAALPSAAQDQEEEFSEIDLRGMNSPRAFEVPHSTSDGLGQELDNLRMELEAIKDLLSSNQRSTLQRLSSIQDQIDRLNKKIAKERALNLASQKRDFLAKFALLHKLEDKTDSLNIMIDIMSFCGYLGALTDLRLYGSFSSDLDKALKMARAKEKNRLIGFLDDSLVKEVATLASLEKELNLASIALKKLRELLPFKIQKIFGGRKLSQKYSNMICAFEKVSSAHEEIRRMIASAKLMKGETDSAHTEISKILDDYKFAMCGRRDCSMAEFHESAALRFEEPLGENSINYETFKTRVGDLNFRAERARIVYCELFSKYTEYLSSVRQALHRRSYDLCLEAGDETDAEDKAKKAHLEAIQAMDAIIEEIERKYLKRVNSLEIAAPSGQLCS